MIFQKEYEQMMKKIAEDDELFRAELSEKKIITENEEIKNHIDKLNDFLEILDTKEVMEIRNREEIKNIIYQDISNNAILGDIDISKNSLNYIKNTEQIELFFLKEIARLKATILFLIDKIEGIQEYEQESPRIEFPDKFPILFFKYSTANNSEEKMRIIREIRKLDNQDFIKKIMKQRGIEYD